MRSKISYSRTKPDCYYKSNRNEMLKHIPKNVKKHWNLAAGVEHSPLWLKTHLVPNAEVLKLVTNHRKSFRMRIFQLWICTLLNFVSDIFGDFLIHSSYNYNTIKTYTDRYKLRQKNIDQ